MTYHASMMLEKHYTCWIERKGDGIYLTTSLSVLLVGCSIGH